MKRLIVLVLVVVGGGISSVQAQLLLSPGESYAYQFSSADLTFFGSGNAGPARGSATFYSDLSKSTPGATFTVDLFENNVGESPIGTRTGSGSSVIAPAVGGWQDLQGVARVTVNSGNVFFDTVLVNVYTPTGDDPFEQFSSGNVPVPEPATMTLGAFGLAGLLACALKRRRR